MTASVETRTVLTEVQNSVAAYTEESGVAVSLQAQELIASVLGGFLFDPHPAWNADRTLHTQYFNKHMANLPKYLTEIGRRPGMHGIITSFDVLAWLGDNLWRICDYTCPFPKGTAR